MGGGSSKVSARLWLISLKRADATPLGSVYVVSDVERRGCCCRSSIDIEQSANYHLLWTSHAHWLLPAALSVWGSPSWLPASFSQNCSQCVGTLASGCPARLDNSMLYISQARFPFFTSSRKIFGYTISIKIVKTAAFT